MRIKLLLGLSILALNSFSQSPKLINYQGSARRTDGTPIVNKVLGIKFELIEGSVTRSVVTSETQTVLTNNYGLFNTQIGKNGVNTSSVNWQNGPHFLQVSIDTTGTLLNFLGTYTTQISSVPFAIHSENVPSSYTNNILTIGNSTYAISSGVTPTITALGVLTNTTVGNNFTLNVANPVLSSTANVLSISQGSAVSTVTLPAQVSQTVSVIGVASATNGLNSATISVPNPILSNTANVVSISQGSAVSTITLPTQSSQTLASLGIATVTNGINSATITVPNPVLTSNGSTLTITQGTAVTTATVPAQIPQTISGAGIASSANGLNSATISVPAPVLSNTANVLAINQGTAISTVTLPSQVPQTITGSGIASSNNGLNSATITVPAPVLSNTANVLAINQGTAISTVTIPITHTISGAGIASVVPLSGTAFTVSVPNPTLSNVGGSITLTQGSVVTSATLPVQTNQTITGVGLINAGSVTANSFTVSVPNPTLSNGGGSITLTQGTVVTSAVLPVQTNQTITGVGIINAGSVTANSFTVSVPNPTLTSNSNSITITQGSVVTTATVPLQITQTITAAGIASVTSPASNSFVVTVNQPTFAYSQTNGSLTSGTSSANITPNLTFTNNVLTSGPASNSVTINTGWGLTGNAGTTPSLNFIGTTDNNALNFRVFNAKAGIIDPNGPVFLGYQAGATNTVTNNVGIGYQALASNTSGSQNVGLGFQTLSSNTTGTDNIAIGTAALYANTTGNYNVAISFESLRNNTTGYSNMAVGEGALRQNTTGSNNSAFGFNALYYNTTGGDNVAIGAYANSYAGIGTQNVAVGSAALLNNSGTKNVALGFSAMGINSTGQENSATGYKALYNSTASFNTANGAWSLFNNSMGQENSASGYQSLYSNSTGSFNTANGSKALINNTTGGNNVSLGNQSGFLNSTGSSNVFIGNQAGYYETGSSKLYIHNTTNSVTPLIYGDFSTGKLGINTNTITEALNVGGNIRLSGALMPNNLAGTTGQVLTSQGTGAAPIWTTVASNGWGLTGNAGTTPSLNFIGTTDTPTLNFKVNNFKAGTIDNNGPTFIGYKAGNVNVATANSGFGYTALQNNTSGSSNSGFGYGALSSNTTGNRNSAFGALALSSNSTGIQNAAFGVQSMNNNTTGSSNSAFGDAALYSNTNGTENTAFGFLSMYNTTTGSYNTAIGSQVFYNNTTGQQNVTIGRASMYNNTIGSFNTAYGNAAMYGNTTGGSNVAMGYNALQNGTSGTGNTAIGSQAIGTGTSTGNYNTALGFQSMYNNASGQENTATGYTSLFSNTSGSYNTANGSQALKSNTTGQQNSAFGYQALTLNTTGGFNSVLGTQAMASNTAGGYNVAVGYVALNSNISGNFNSAVGAGALISNTSGNNNSALGYEAMHNNTTGGGNTSLGYNALWNNTTGAANIAIGSSAMFSNTSGYENTAIGQGALGPNSSGIQNVALGYASGGSNLGSGNVFLGYASGFYETGNNKLWIANTTTSTTPLIQGDFSTGKVAINKASPSEALDVSGNVRFSGALMPNNTAGTAGQYLQSQGSGSVPVWAAAPTATFAYSQTNGSLTSGTSSVNTTPSLALSGYTISSGPASNSINLSAISPWSQTGGTVALNTSTSNVGIGVSNPTNKLAVSSTTTTPNFAQYTTLNFNPSSNPGGAAGAGYFINNFNGTGGTQLNTAITGYLSLAGGASSSSYNTGAWLHGISSGGSHNNVMGVLGSTEVYGATVGSVYGGYFTHMANTGTVTNGYGVYVGSVFGTNKWSLYSSDATAPNYFAGMVGVGTTAPAYSVDVVGTGGPRARVYSQDGNYAGYISKNTSREFFAGVQGTYEAANGTNSGYHIYDNTANARRMVIDYLGRMGINNSAPTATLDVIGTFKLADGSQGAGKVLTSDASGNATWSTSASGSGWGLTGNAGTTPSLNFIGTTDTYTLNFKINNQNAGKIDGVAQNVFFGRQAGNNISTGSNNIAYGGYALFSNSTGGNNSATGFSALYNNSIGTENTANGYYTMYNTTSGSYNTAIGSQALYFNTTGQENVSIGRASLSQNTGGSYNTAIGDNALYFGTSGQYNTALGFSSGYSAGGASGNVFIGSYAGYYETTNNKLWIANTTTSTTPLVYGNFAAGRLGINQAAATEALDVSGNVKFSGALMPNNAAGTSGQLLVSQGTGAAPVWSTVASASGWGLTGNAGTTPSLNFIGTTDNKNLNFKVNNQSAGAIDYTNQNTFFGYLSGSSSPTTQGNTAIGTNAGKLISTGGFNTALGWGALTSNTSGQQNVSLGFSAMSANVSGGYNSIVGMYALTSNISGSSNSALGWGAGYNNLGSNNVFLGNNAGYYETGSNKLYISNSTTSVNPLIYGDFSTGNLALGLVNPSQKLSVDGNIGLDDAAASSAPSRTIGFATATPGNHGMLTIQAKSTVFNGSAFVGGNLLLAAGDFNFSGATNSNGGDVFIRAGKNTFDGSGGGNIIFQAAGNAYTERMRVEGVSGRVGIGTNAPSATLHVNGTTRLVDGTQGAGKVLTSDASGNASWLAPATSSSNICFIKDIKTSGTDGGGFSSGAWQTRDLNTIEGNASLVNLASNQFTLQPGTYLFQIEAPGYGVTQHKVKLRNITDAADALVGLSAYASSANNVQSNSVLKGVITITSSKVFQVQHYCTTTRATNGFGLNSSFGVNEVYSQVQITKLQ